MDQVPFSQPYTPLHRYRRSRTALVMCIRRWFQGDTLVSILDDYCTAGQVVNVTPSRTYLSAAGDDLWSGSVTLAEAEERCNNLTDCLGFTYSGPLNPVGVVNVYLKSAINFVQAGGQPKPHFLRTHSHYYAYPAVFTAGPGLAVVRFKSRVGESR